jgi:hypothetical protein
MLDFDHLALYAFPIVVAFAVKFPEQSADDVIPALLKAAWRLIHAPSAQSAAEAMHALGDFCLAIPCDEETIRPIFSHCAELLAEGAEDDQIHPDGFYRATLVTFSKLYRAYVCGQGVAMDSGIAVFMKALRRSGPCNDLIFVVELLAAIARDCFQTACEICGEGEVRERIVQHITMRGVPEEVLAPLRAVVDGSEATPELSSPIQARPTGLVF